MTDDVAPGRTAHSRRGAWAELGVVLGLMAALFVGSAVAANALGLKGGVETVLARVSMPAFMLLLCLAATALMRRRGESWRSLGLAAPSSVGRTVGLVIGGYFLLGVMAFVMSVLVFPAFDIEANSAKAFGALEGDLTLYLTWLVLAWTSAAVGEELLFRGFIRSRLEWGFGGGRWASAGALVGQAMIFSLGHGYQGLGGVLLTGGAGLILGLVYLGGRRNLIACILLHGLIDTVSLTAVFLGALPDAAVG